MHVGFRSLMVSSEVPVTLQSRTGVSMSAKAIFSSIICDCFLDSAFEHKFTIDEQKSKICFFELFRKLGSFGFSTCYFEYKIAKSTKS